MKASIHLGQNHEDLQKHRLRGTQDIVRHLAVTDLEPEARDQTGFHD